MSKYWNTLIISMLLLSLLNCQKRSVLEEKENINLNLKSMHGPYYIEKMVRNYHVNISDNYKIKIAADRWKIAIDGAVMAKRPIPILNKIIGNETALLVIDMQKAFLDTGAAIEVPKGLSLIDKINNLSGNIRAKNGLVIFFRYKVSDNPGLLKYFENQSYLGDDRESPLVALQSNHEQFQLHPDLHILPSDIIMDKTRYSAVLGSAIVDTLRNKNIKNVLITGVTTDVCAGGTAESLMQVDFNVIMAWDGCAALDRFEHEIYLARIFGLYGDVMPIKEIIKRLE